MGFRNVGVDVCPVTSLWPLSYIIACLTVQAEIAHRKRFCNARKIVLQMNINTSTLEIKKI